ncbi:MAG: ribonuclease J [Clostridia bacterium]|nr:ribonuclease J [Clostridia bacterium]
MDNQKAEQEKTVIQNSETATKSKKSLFRAPVRKKEAQTEVLSEPTETRVIVEDKPVRKKRTAPQNAKSKTETKSCSLEVPKSKNKTGSKARGVRQQNSSGKLTIIPLGGLGEIGKNMTAIKYGNNIIVIDSGMSFPDDELLGIDLVIPDYTYLLENKDIVRAIIVTHGHEDHIGAIPYMLKDLQVPIYGAKLTLGLLEGKFKEHRLGNVSLNPVKPRDTINIGPFKVEFIKVSHSIPDSLAVAVHTPVGILLHTGDFKVDMSPIDGEVMDLRRFAALGEEGVLVMCADSTNVERDGYTHSEKSVGTNLENIFRGAKGRIIVTTFASNVHRVQQIIWAAEYAGRRVAIVGRGMVNVATIAVELGYLSVKRDTFIDIDEINKLPDDKIVVITTGSQGESLSGLTRMAVDEHRQIHIRPGDLVVISANAIPGNEKLIARTVDNLYRHGAEVIYGSSAGIHVSGHASAEDLKLMLNMVKPKYFIPVHGEYRMLHSHAKLAENLGIPKENIFVMEIGNVLELSPSKGKITGKVPSGRILIDGFGVGDVGTAVLKDRKQLANEGIVVVNIVFDHKLGQIISGPQIISRGFVFEKENERLMKMAEEKVLQTWSRFAVDNNDIAGIKGSIRGNLGKFFYDRTGRRPIILPVIMEI